jgi:hypothetical protein
MASLTSVSWQGTNTAASGFSAMARLISAICSRRAVGRLRHVVGGRRAKPRGGAVGAEPRRGVGRIGAVLGEDGDAHVWLGFSIVVPAKAGSQLSVCIRCAMGFRLRGHDMGENPHSGL